jgi:hypothetical protein
MSETNGSALGDVYDYWHRLLNGAPHVTATKLANKLVSHPVTEVTQTFTVQTMRHEAKGDYVFLQFVNAAGSHRIVLPPQVADLIARQREAITGMNRKRAARDSAAKRKAAGIQPAFLKAKKRGKKS